MNRHDPATLKPGSSARCASRLKFPTKNPASSDTNAPIMRASIVLLLSRATCHQRVTVCFGQYFLRLVMLAHEVRIGYYLIQIGPRTIGMRWRVVLKAEASQ